MTTESETMIHLEAVFPAAKEGVYALLTNGEKFAEATGRPGSGGEIEGAGFSLFGGWLVGRQIELVPNERIVQAWRFAEWEPGVFSLVKFTFVPEG
ncbi:MAG TPA: SRPBCC domain-containing protein, partial [Mucilaginibacter sp.]